MAEPAKTLPPQPTVMLVAVASVTIIRAEPVDVLNAPKAEQQDRQYGSRGSMPIVEFF